MIIKINKLVNIQLLLIIDKMDKISRELQYIIIEHGLDDIKKVYMAGLFDDNLISNESARTDNFELLKWLIDQGVELTSKLSASACLSGDINMVKYLKNKNDQNKLHIFDWQASAWAGLGGHLPIIKYLQSIKCPWDKWTTANAAKNNHRKFLEWCVENGCEVTEDAAIFAAASGHVDMLEYLKSINIPITKLVKLTALKHIQTIVVQWYENQN